MSSSVEVHIFCPGVYNVGDEQVVDFQRPLSINRQTSQDIIRTGINNKSFSNVGFLQKKSSESE